MIPQLITLFRNEDAVRLLQETCLARLKWQTPNLVEYSSGVVVKPTNLWVRKLASHASGY